jgi:predicted nucleic acid-binding protein
VPLIADANVTIAWFVRNQATGYTDRIRRQVRGERIHVPAVWPLEFANALWQLQRRKLLHPGLKEPHGSRAPEGRQVKSPPQIGGFFQG